MIGGWSFVPGKPLVRGYDTSTLFREDCLERINHLQADIDDSLKEMGSQRRNATEERLRKLKKEFGWID